MKKVLLAALALLQISVISFAKVSTKPEDFELNHAKIENSCAYTIEIPGKMIQPGFYSPAKIYRIPKLDKKDYLPNVIKIKTKQYLPTSPKNEITLSSGLDKILSKLDITKIECPYTKYADEPISTWDKVGVSRTYLIRYNASVDPIDLGKELMTCSEVEFAVPEVYTYISYIPNDPRYSEQYALAKLQCEKAWDISKGLSTVVIGIVDNAIDYTHPDLAKNIWLNALETQNGKDDDGNGYIDDIRGWDFYYGDNDVKAKDVNQSHGTHVSGCAAAVTNNAVGVAAPAGNCKILPVKIGSDNSSSPGLQNGYEGILYAAQMKAKVINCSWGGPFGDPSGQDIINQAVTKYGASIVVAAGNDNQYIDMTPTYPASYDNVICVGATDKNDQKTYFSNYGVSVDVWAPGQGILSTMPNANYASEDGTSMASPITAGVVALIRSVFTNYTPEQVKEQLRATCDNISTSVFVRGRINAYKSIYYNNSLITGSKKTPGCIVKSFYINGGDKITDYTEKTIRLTIKNVLSNCSNLQVKLSTSDKFVDIPVTTYSIGALAGQAEKDLDVKLTVNSKNPWFEGDVQLYVTFTDGEYTDTKLVPLPLSISSTNRYNFDAYFNPEYDIQWNTVSSYDAESFWAVGQSNYTGFVFTNSTIQSMYPLGIPAYGVFSFSAKKAIITVSPNTGKTYLNTTTNGGSSWTTFDTKDVTSFINGIYFKDVDNGIILGDPINGTWGLAMSTDGGNMWSQYTTIPAPETGETAILNANCFMGDNVWFGSSKGNVYYSTNFGQTWNVSKVKDGIVIEKVVFSNIDSGMVTYYTSQTGPRYIAYTNDGGKTWKFQSGDVSKFAFTPIYYSNIKDSKAIVALSQMGELFYTLDFGSSWTPILNKRTAMVNNGFLVKGQSTYRMYQAGSYFGHCDFVPPIDNITKILDFGGVKEIKFDSTEIGTSVKKPITISNKGNTKITITYEYSPIGNVGVKEFANYIAAPSYINPGLSGTINVKFTPEKTGLRTCKLIVRTDGTPTEYQINLIGYGKASTTTKLISVNNVSKVTFDSTEIDKSSSKSIVVNNTGTGAITINDVIFNTGASSKKEFVLKSPSLPIDINAGASTTLNIDFKPTGSEGLRTNVLHIYSDATPDDITIDLQGYGKISSGVEDSNFNTLEAVINPNPTKDVLNLSLNSTINGEYVFDILSYSGEVLYSENQIVNGNNITLDIRNLTNGAYYLRIKSGDLSKSIKFVVSK